LNLYRSCEDLLEGWDFFQTSELESVDMPKAIRFSATLPTKAVSEEADSKQSDSSMFVSVALFSGLGLLVSLVAILFGLTLGWY
jgi:hypothetical protein